MRVRLIIVAGVVALAAATTASPVWAGWGCGYRFNGLAEGRYGSVWGEPNEAEAKDAALGLCKRAGHDGCYIVACKTNIETKDQAQALWPLNGPSGACYGTGCK
jgi:hypothetical protein